VKLRHTQTDKNREYLDLIKNGEPILLVNALWRRHNLYEGIGRVFELQNTREHTGI
jgi:hypothetical protein